MRLLKSYVESWYTEHELNLDFGQVRNANSTFIFFLNQSEVGIASVAGFAGPPDGLVHSWLSSMGGSYSVIFLSERESEMREKSFLSLCNSEMKLLLLINF